MNQMLAVVPDPWIADSKVVGTGTDEGVPSDASIELHLWGGQSFTLRTLLRLGEQIGSAEWPSQHHDGRGVSCIVGGKLFAAASHPGWTAAGRDDRTDEQGRCGFQEPGARPRRMVICPAWAEELVELDDRYDGFEGGWGDEPDWAQTLEHFLLASIPTRAKWQQPAR